MPLRAKQLTEIRDLKCRLLRQPERRAIVAAAVLLLPGALTPAHGQEAVRMSIASAEAAEARRRAATTVGYYDLRLGPTAWNFGTGLGLEYNSNVNYTEANPSGDFIFRPQANTRMLWPVSDQNSLNLALGGGYSAYVSNQRLDRIFINPDSELSFDLYIGEFWVNLHDRFSITENTYQDPTVAGSGNYSQLQNALGVATTWDLNKAIVRAGYDHVNYDSLNSGDNQNFGVAPSGDSEVFSASAGFMLKQEMLVGLEVGDSLINYTTVTLNTPYSNANQWNVGGFYDAPVSDYLHVAAHAGYSVYSPDAGGTTAAGGDFSGVYAQLDVTHRVNQFLSYTLSGGRTISVVFTGGTIDRYFAHWQANWAILRKLTLGTSFSYERGTQLIAGGETYDQYGPGISLSRLITAKLSSSLGYQIYWRDSNLSDRNYTLNVVSLNFNYTF